MRYLLLICVLGLMPGWCKGQGTAKKLQSLYYRFTGLDSEEYYFFSDGTFAYTSSGCGVGSKIGEGTFVRERKQIRLDYADFDTTKYMSRYTIGNLPVDKDSCIIEVSVSESNGVTFAGAPIAIHDGGGRTLTATGCDVDGLVRIALPKADILATLSIPYPGGPTIPISLANNYAIHIDYWPKINFIRSGQQTTYLKRNKRRLLVKPFNRDYFEPFVKAKPNNKK